MSLAKLAAACGLIVVALSISACGIQAKPVAGTVNLSRAAGNHTKVDDPRKPYLSCLRRQHFSFTKLDYGPQHLRALQIGGAGSAGATVVFEPTPGIAEGDQMKGEMMGAEVIGSALVFPNREPDKTMKKIEACVSSGVSG
ncbi:MAG: hypothetical protein J2O48_06675 [Solirubrobacterales bacterium]|nr:hypothetical protein [Solirubrobacterales bacterium]